MPIREESYDLFGAASGSPSVYSYEKAVSTSANGSITGNALDLRSPKPALVDEYRIKIDITTAITGLSGTDGITATILTCDTNSATAGDWKTIITGAKITTFTKGTPVLRARLPQDCKRWIKAVITNAGTATGGKVGGNVEPIV